MKLEEVINFCKEEEIRQKETGKEAEALGCDATDFWKGQILWYQLYNWLSELNVKREIVASQSKIIRNLYSKLEQERTKKIAVWQDYKTISSNYKCSNCSCNVEKIYNFCPSCGCAMRKE